MILRYFHLCSTIRTLQIEPSERTLENASGDLSVQLKLTALERQTVSEELGMSQWRSSHSSFGAYF